MYLIMYKDDPRVGSALRQAKKVKYQQAYGMVMTPEMYVLIRLAAFGVPVSVRMHHAFGLSL